MRKLAIIIGFAVFGFLSCKPSEKENNLISEETKELAYSSYGAEIVEQQHMPASEMEKRYQDLGQGDTLQLSFKTTVNSVCKNKGCWMTLNLPREEEVMVKFRDYDFFVPKDIEEKEVVVSGKAYVTQVSVEEQQHYARDNGKTEKEIAAITQPKRTLSFLADGVQIMQ